MGVIKLGALLTIIVKSHQQKIAEMKNNYERK